MILYIVISCHFPGFLVHREQRSRWSSFWIKWSVERVGHFLWFFRQWQQTQQSFYYGHDQWWNKSLWSPAVSLHLPLILNRYFYFTIKYVFRDGSTQQLAGCLRDFRNKPFPVRAKIEYYQNTLTVREITFFPLFWISTN